MNGTEENDERRLQKKRMYITYRITYGLPQRFMNRVIVASSSK